MEIKECPLIEEDELARIIRETEARIDKIREEEHLPHPEDVLLQIKAETKK